MCAAPTALVVLVLCTQRLRAGLTCVAPLALRRERSKPESGLKPGFRMCVCVVALRGDIRSANIALESAAPPTQVRASALGKSRFLGPTAPSRMTCLTTNGREEKHQERGEAQGAADGVQCCPALQELFRLFGVFVQGGIEEALVGGEDNDQGEGEICFLQGLKPNAEARVTWELKLPPPREAAAKAELLRMRAYRALESAAPPDLKSGASTEGKKQVPRANTALGMTYVASAAVACFLCGQFYVQELRLNAFLNGKLPTREVSAAWDGTLCWGKARLSLGVLHHTPDFWWLPRPLFIFLFFDRRRRWQQDDFAINCPAFSPELLC
jgi:hypothetical protein